jgi:UDP-3-O-[3-hydroxymyristoyl] glucosamine N-acyltransferase
VSEVTLGEIVDLVGGTFRGSREQRVDGVASLAEATERQISFLHNPKYAAQVASSRAAAILVASDLAGDDACWIRVKDPYFAMAQTVAKWFDNRPKPPVGVSPLASVASSAKLGANVRVGAFTSIGNDVVIGDDVTIYSHVAIEDGATIGDGSILYPHVSVYYACRIGKRCILHSGVVIGSDGYGFATSGGRLR